MITLSIGISLMTICSAQISFKTIQKTLISYQNLGRFSWHILTTPQQSLQCQVRLEIKRIVRQTNLFSQT
jgi:hypothetical protein